MTTLRSYVLDDVSEVIVSKGPNPGYLHFGVTTEECSCHFTLTVRVAEALENFLFMAVEEAGGRVEEWER